MARYRSIRDLDWPLLLNTLFICSVGILQIYSAAHDTVWYNAWWKQAVYVIVGFGVMWMVARIDYHNLLNRAFIFYVLSLVGLVLVLTVGQQAFGSRRWIPLPGFHLQISEFVKTVIILLVARYLTELKTDRVEGRDLLKLGGLVLVPMLLVIKQPDLGTALCYLPVLAIGILLAGLRWQYVASIAIILTLVLPMGWFFVLKDYQKARLVTFLDPEQDPRGSGYQVIQSKIAVGAGGLWGKGVTRGSQTQLRFLPVPHTDFIFSAFSEEHGFVGVWLDARVLLCAADADRAERADGAGPGRNVYLHGRLRPIVVPYFGEHRDGGRPHAGHGHSSAADELRRLQHPFVLFDAGPGEQCQALAICQLKRLSVVSRRDRS